MLSFGAGAVHLVMVPQHAQDSLRMGVAFAAAGWFQVAFGAALLAAPRRLWLWLAIVLNVLFVATWAVSRTVGLPTWTGDGGTEVAASVDTLCVVFEVAVVIGSVTLLVAPRLLEHWRMPALTVAGIVSVVVLLGTTIALASPSTTSHAHGHDETTGVAAAVHQHGTASEAASAHVHDTAATPIAADHVHTESTITYDQLPKQTKAEVDEVIALWGNRYATAADAMKDGWFKATRSLYGIGAHYLRATSVRGTSIFGGSATFDRLNPNILLFDGDGPDAKFAGVSYVLPTVPEGFSGPYDSWHSHASVCLQGGTVVSLTEENSPVWLTESECRARGWSVLPLANAEMMHLWIGPEYIDGAAIFAHDNPKLYDGYNPRRDA